MVSHNRRFAIARYVPRRAVQRRRNSQATFDASPPSDEQPGFRWDIQRGGTVAVTGVAPHQRFGIAGAFGVTLRVTAGHGERSTVEKQQVVVVNDETDGDGPARGGGARKDDGGDDRAVVCLTPLAGAAALRPPLRHARRT